MISVELVFSVCRSLSVHIEEKTGYFIQSAQCGGCLFPKRLSWWTEAVCECVDIIVSCVECILNPMSSIVPLSDVFCG